MRFETMIRIIFDGPPGPEAGCFVEIEDAYGNSIKVGKWYEHPDGMWELCITKQDWENLK